MRHQPMIWASLGCVAVMAVGCGGDSGAPGGGGTSIFGPQPKVISLDVSGSLGLTLGSPEAEVDASSGRVVQAVAGAAHVCALDARGAVLCAGDRPASAAAATRWPADWGRVKGLPEGVTMLLSASSSTCATTLSGGLWCWGEVAYGPPEASDYLTARRVVGPGGGSGQIGALVHAQGLWSVRAICTTDGAARLRCFTAGGDRDIDLPTRIVGAASLEGQLHVLAGSRLYRVSPATGSVEEVAGLPDLVSVSNIGGQLCGLTASGDGHCLPGVLGPDPELTFTAPGATALAGGCVLEGGGALRCGLPLVDRPACDLGLLRAEGYGPRGCGPTAAGAWICYGRPFTSAPRGLDNLVDRGLCP